MEERYIPSGTSIEQVFQSLNDYTQEELAFPGNWPESFFFEDLKTYPVQTKQLLVVALQKALHEHQTYLEFFQVTRGFEHPREKDHPEIWKLFDRGSLMLHFEQLFKELLDKSEHNQDERVIIAYLKALSKTPVAHWNAVVEGIGACCYEFFGKEPYLYARLIRRNNADQAEDMTDPEILEAIQIQISPKKSRSDLIQLYQKCTNSEPAS